MDFDALANKIFNMLLMIAVVLVGGYVGWHLLGRLIAKYGDMFFKF